MFKIFEKDGEEYASLDPKYKKQIIQKRYEYLLVQSNIPRFYWDIEFKDYKGENSKSNLEKVIFYAKNFKDKKFNHVHLYLYGANNSQKTAIACNIAKEIIKQGYSTKFILAGSLIDKLIKLQGYSFNEEIYNEINVLKQCDAIIIDDIFDQSKSVFWSKPESASLIITAWDSFLREIVSSPTKLILTSNIPIDMIAKKFGESLYHLIDRNFICLGFFDDVKIHRKKRFDNLFSFDDTNN